MNKRDLQVLLMAVAFTLLSLPPFAFASDGKYEQETLRGIKKRRSKCTGSPLSHFDDWCLESFHHSRYGVLLHFYSYQVTPECVFGAKT